MTKARYNIFYDINRLALLSSSARLQAARLLSSMMIIQNTSMSVTLQRLLVVNVTHVYPVYN